MVGGIDYSYSGASAEFIEIYKENTLRLLVGSA